jgi:hypothetical protein
MMGVNYGHPVKGVILRLRSARDKGVRKYETIVSTRESELGIRDCKKSSGNPEHSSYHE